MIRARHWSALISVTMIKLAVEYFVGGRWADRAHRTGLSLVIGFAGVFTLGIPWPARPVLLLTEPLGLRAGAFGSALILFFPSLSLLRMAGLFAIKLSTTRLERVGTSAGSIYAVHIVGSVAGTLLLGFFLFRLIGTREVLIGLGLGLLVLALLVGIYESRRLGISHALVSCLLTLGLGLAVTNQVRLAEHTPVGSTMDGYQFRFEEVSLYGWVQGTWL